jgi:hypothetical protein
MIGDGGRKKIAAEVRFLHMRTCTPKKGGNTPPCHTVSILFSSFQHERRHLKEEGERKRYIPCTQLQEKEIERKLLRRCVSSFSGACIWRKHTSEAIFFLSLSLVIVGNVCLVSSLLPLSNGAFHVGKRRGGGTRHGMEVRFLPFWVRNFLFRCAHEGNAPQCNFLYFSFSVNCEWCCLILLWK